MTKIQVPRPLILRILHAGSPVMTVDMKDMDPDHLKIVERIGKPVEIFRAASAECNAEFVSQWSVGSVAGMYRLSKGRC